MRLFLAFCLKRESPEWVIGEMNFMIGRGDGKREKNYPLFNLLQDIHFQGG